MQSRRIRQSPGRKTDRPDYGGTLWKPADKLTHVLENAQK